MLKQSLANIIVFFAHDPHPPEFLKVFYLRGCPNLAPVVDIFSKLETPHIRDAFYLLTLNPIKTLTPWTMEP